MDYQHQRQIKDLRWCVLNMNIYEEILYCKRRTKEGSGEETCIRLRVSWWLLVHCQHQTHDLRLVSRLGWLCAGPASCLLFAHARCALCVLVLLPIHHPQAPRAQGVY